MTAGTSPLVQKLLPDGPGEKADQRVLLQGVIQKLLEVVHLRGVIRAQLILEARASSKSHEKTLSTTFWAEVSLSRVICPVGTRALLLTPRHLPHRSLSPDSPPLPPFCHPSWDRTCGLTHCWWAYKVLKHSGGALGEEYIYLYLKERKMGLPWWSSS